MANNTMINYKIFNTNAELGTKEKARFTLRLEVLQYTGTTLDLNGRVTNEGIKLYYPQFSVYKIKRLYRNGIIQGVRLDADYPILPFYTVNYDTGVITFDTTQGVDAPAGDNIIIELEYYKII